MTSPLNKCAAISLALTLSACVYVPVVDEHDTTSTRCKTFTQSMSLEAVEIRGNISHDCHNDDCAALLASIAVVTAGSVIISGSIVLAGNTVHWLEYQGTCSDGYLNKTKQSFLDSINKLKQIPATPQSNTNQTGR